MTTCYHNTAEHAWNQASQAGVCVVDMAIPELLLSLRLLRACRAY